MRLLVEWDEESALLLAETVWNAGSSVRILAESSSEEDRGGVLEEPNAPSSPSRPS